jgi:hypothetical protein
MPCGIERLNTVNCRYYGISGLSRKVKNWYMGMFMEHIFDWFEADYILDMEAGVWWWTGSNNENQIKRLEKEYADRRRSAA